MSENERKTEATGGGEREVLEVGEETLEAAIDAAYHRSESALDVAGWLQRDFVITARGVATRIPVPVREYGMDEFPWKSKAGRISSAVRTDVTPNFRPARNDPDERPATCVACGAPFVWCKCHDAAREKLTQAIMDAGWPLDEVLAAVDDYTASLLVQPKRGELA